MSGLSVDLVFLPLEEQIPSTCHDGDEEIMKCSGILRR